MNANDGLHEFKVSILSLSKFLDRDHELALVTIRDLWPEVVGGNLVGHSLPQRIEDNKLYVAVDSSSSMTATKLASKRILKALCDQGFYFVALRVEAKRRIEKNFVNVNIEGE